MQKKKFMIKEGSHINGVDKEKVIETLLEIDTKNGEINAQIVLDHAKNIDSPLHNYFEWDDTKAANNHRLSQAQKLIGCIIFKYEEVKEDTSTRYFVNVTQYKEEDGEVVPKRTYVNFERVIADERLKNEMLKNLLKDLSVLKNKYKNFVDMKEIEEMEMRLKRLPAA